MLMGKYVWVCGFLSVCVSVNVCICVYLYVLCKWCVGMSVCVAACL